MTKYKWLKSSQRQNSILKKEKKEKKSEIQYKLINYYHVVW